GQGQRNRQRRVVGPAGEGDGLAARRSRVGGDGEGRGGGQAGVVGGGDGLGAGGAGGRRPGVGALVGAGAVVAAAGHAGDRGEVQLLDPGLRVGARPVDGEARGVRALRVVVERRAGDVLDPGGLGDGEQRRG